MKRIDKAIREFLPTADERYVTEVFAALDELARVHVYFELVRFERQSLSFEPVDEKQL